MKKGARLVKYLKLTVPIDYLLIYGLIQTSYVQQLYII